MKDVFVLFVMIVFVSAVSYRNETECPNEKTKLSFIRKRRHVTFPDGSNVVLTISVVKAFLTHAPAGWNLALEIDVLFPLPNSNFTLAHQRRKLHHRQKRELWDRLKSALALHSLDGHICVLQIICDAKTYLLPPGMSMIHDLLRAIFTAPHHEEEFQEEIKSTYNELTDPNFCEKITHCPFSLLGFLIALNGG